MVSFVKCIILKLKQKKAELYIHTCTVKPASTTTSIKHIII